MSVEEVENINTYVTEGNCVTPLGFNATENIKNLLSGRISIKSVTDEKFHDQPFCASIIDDSGLNAAFSKLDGIDAEKDYSKLEKMIVLAVAPIVEKYHNKIDGRCGVIISSTKGNIDALSSNRKDYFLHELASKITSFIGSENEPIVISNACVSGVMAISVAKNLIQTGVYDHFIIVAADVFSKFVFSGFQSFQAVSDSPCKPYSKNRDGITLGEAAAAIFVTKERAILKEDAYEVIGDSSINDANHISGPSRTGEGLYLSIKNAMNQAGIKPDKIDCISSHGTATVYNDEMEAQAFNRANLIGAPVFSLKGCFGHTLGAAGLLETVLTLKAASENKILPSFGYDDEPGVSLPLNITAKVVEKETHTILKTASGFGGSNTAVIFSKV